MPTALHSYFSSTYDEARRRLIILSLKASDFGDMKSGETKWSTVVHRYHPFWPQRGDRSARDLKRNAWR